VTHAGPRRTVSKLSSPDCGTYGPNGELIVHNWEWFIEDDTHIVDVIFDGGIKQKLSGRKVTMDGEMVR
jgi:hypothetical protein